MTAVSLRFRAEFRSRWRAWTALAVFIGLVAGAVLALAAGARRTDDAYQRFLKAQHAYDVAMPITTYGEDGPTQIYDLDRIRRLPEVAETVKASTFFVSVGAGVGVLVPKNERLGTEINTFKMLDGRRPDPNKPNEVAVSFTYAEQYGVGVGDTIPLIDPTFLGPPPPDLDPETVRFFTETRDRVLEAIPDNRLRIVGVEASPGEFPPQIEGTSRDLVHASPALYPLRRDIGALSEAADAILVRLRNGERDVDEFLGQLKRLGGGDETNVRLQRDFTTPVDRSLHTQAVALQILALLAALVGALILGQLQARLTFVESADHRALAALGMSPGQRFGLGVVRSAAIGVIGAPVAFVFAMLLSPVFPVGLARTAEPDSGLHLDATVLFLGVLAVVIVVVLLAAWPSWRASRVRSGPEAVPTRTSVAGRFVTAKGAPLPVSTGVRMALDPGSGRSAVPVLSSLAGVTLGILTLVATITFGAGLAHLLATPALYGKTWDVELTTYDGTLVSPRGARLLASDDRVAATAAGNFRVGFLVDGHQVDGLAQYQRKSDFNPTILEGRAPERPREIVLGTRTLRSLDLSIGDTAKVGLFTVDVAPVSMRVVGRAVFPVFGITGQLGDGALVNVEGAKLISKALASPSEASVLVRLAPGVDPQRLAADLTEKVGTTVYLIDQGKPTDILNFGRVESTPYILGAILAALAIATFAHLLMSATRRRRRELAVLKTLGFVRGQLRATVAWQAMTLVVVALVVGIPVGIGVGRWAWTVFAEQLGVVVEPRVPMVAILLLVPAGLLVANLVAAIPAAIAARTRPAVVLRSE